MNTNRLLLTTAILCIAVPGSVFSANPFPTARDQPAGCDHITWPEVLSNSYPRVIDACQEVVVTKDGTKWARFDGTFENIARDGKLTFAIQDSNRRSVDDVYVTPGVNQVAYIDGRETQFKDLRRGQKLNLYLPEGGTGFSTSVDRPAPVIAVIEPRVVNDDAVAANARPAPLNSTLDNVQFTLGSAALSESTKRALDTEVRMLNDNPSVNLMIAGHTSASASNAFNQKLSERRAEAVRAYLVDVGRIDRKRLATIGYGETRPLEVEVDATRLNSDAAHANMRVEVTIASG